MVRVTSTVLKRREAPISVSVMTCLVRVAPSLSVHASVWTWPVIRTRSPLRRDSAAFSAAFSR